MRRRVKVEFEGTIAATSIASDGSLLADGDKEVFVRPDDHTGMVYVPASAVTVLPAPLTDVSIVADVIGGREGVSVYDYTNGSGTNYIASFYGDDARAAAQRWVEAERSRYAEGDA